MKNIFKLLTISIILLFWISTTTAQIKIHIIEHGVSCVDCFSELDFIFSNFKLQSNNSLSGFQSGIQHSVQVIWHLVVPTFNDTSFLKQKILKKYKSIDSLVFILGKSEDVYKPNSETIFNDKFAAISPSIVLSIGDASKSLSYNRIYRYNKPKKNLLKSIKRLAKKHTTQNNFQLY